ncbi:hypothetical protein Desaci_0790 [Desulfosporosinus acidiphilus SJ4]|uniref:DUF2178 domain-containing protein n=1 Tax=Desulfosporosinus acidiphilus (strain DSM 22704 / JCM 16185 / SJ4) TaxID=646529 RepID=I4D226_DESAJ|nr:hypothetical protein [Desulfosporosinus acidiphilus]AFM39850.1 hypothetical protein Desaci_0790 [Desulfosporosinus acidiphilus SJ4]
MSSKLSLRKKIIMRTISQSVVILFSGEIIMRGQHDMLTKIIAFIPIVFFLSILFYTNRKDCEPRDEMARFNQLKAGNLSYSITLCAIGLVMFYALWFKTSVVISLLNLVFIFVAMYILNLAIFLFYDIRGN